MGASSPAELIGKTDFDFHPPDRAALYLKNEQEMFSTGRPLLDREEQAIDQSTGEEKWYLSHKMPLRDAQGRVIGMVGMNRDITDRRKLEDALERRMLALDGSVDGLSDLKFTDLFDMDEIQRMQDVFAKATGVAVLLTDVEGNPLTENSNFSYLCGHLVRCTELGRTRCAISDAALGRPNPDGPIVQPCLSAGLYGGGASIMVGGQHIANWLVGQVVVDEKDTDQILAYAHEIGVDPDEFGDALAQVTRMPVEQFEAVSQFLFMMARQMSRLALRNLQQGREIAQRQRAESALRDSEQKYQALAENSPDMIARFDRQLRMVYANPAATAFTGLSVDSMLGKRPWELGYPTAENSTPFTSETIQAVFDTGNPHRSEYAFVVSGREFMFDAHFVPEFDADGQVTTVFAVVRDVTEKKQLERRLMESQKMDAIGQLAGGIAHDFNNLLTAILGYANMLKEEAASDSRVEHAATTIETAALRASELTSQLLGFARGGKYHNTPTNMHHILDEVVGLLDRTLDKSISIVRDYQAPTASIMGDPGQMHQSILNLAVNARDAMPEGGTLTLATCVLTGGDLETGTGYDLEPRDYLCVSVGDTGTGISDEHLARIFEPFFTTKQTGTGMGLAMVYGIVKSHGGNIKVSSHPGEGTQIRLYLPLADTIVQAETVKPDEGGDGREHLHTQASTQTSSQGCILLVDDEQVVREVASDMLRSLGYQVITANDGLQAVELFREKGSQIDIAIIDMIMPEMDGRACFQELRRIDPNLRVVLSTGYEIDQKIQDVLDQGVSGFVQKPYRLKQLAAVVAEALPSG
jgi:PAS domain S-box-containing protein